MSDPPADREELRAELARLRRRVHDLERALEASGPDGAPGEIQNVVVRHLIGEVFILDWDPEPLAQSYTVHRGALSEIGYDVSLTCLTETSATQLALLPPNPPPGDGHFYVVSGRNMFGHEGTLGFATCAERSNVSTPCPERP